MMRQKRIVIIGQVPTLTSRFSPANFPVACRIHPRRPPPPHEAPLARARHEDAGVAGALLRRGLEWGLLGGLRPGYAGGRRPGTGPAPAPGGALAWPWSLPRDRDPTTAVVFPCPAVCALALPHLARGRCFLGPVKVGEPLCLAIIITSSSRRPTHVTASRYGLVRIMCLASCVHATPMRQTKVPLTTVTGPSTCPSVRNRTFRCSQTMPHHLSPYKCHVLTIPSPQNPGPVPTTTPHPYPAPRTLLAPSGRPVASSASDSRTARHN